MFDERRAASAPGHGVHYDAAGIAAAVTLVRYAAGENAALLFEFFAELRLSEPVRDSFDPLEIRWIGGDGPKAIKGLRDADDAFSRSFGLSIMSSEGLGRVGGRPESTAELRALLDAVPETQPELSTMFDAATMTWAEITLAARRSGRSHHIAMRCLEDDPRSVIDFAAYLAAAGAQVFYVAPEKPLLAALLRAELLGGGRAVVVVGGLRLVSLATTEGDFGQEITASEAALVPNPAVVPLLKRGAGLANVYVWRVPARGALPQVVRRFLGACFGPARQDPAWRVAHVKELAPGIGARGTQALLSQVDDARDADVMAALAIAIVGTAVPGAVDVDAACRLVGNSFDANTAALTPEPTSEPLFKEDLLACDVDGVRLLAAGQELAQGGRVLVFGVPGTGKSAYARALARRVAETREGASVIPVEPATLLARSWGETERRVAALFQRAHQTNSVLIADEFDSVAAARDEAAPASGNAYLIRTLTNEILRQLDAYPSVPLIATVNDAEALDPAVRRRFSIAVGMRAALSPAQERRAWTALLKMAPPKGWTPCGACVADVVSARERCRLTRRRDAKAHAAAIRAAQATRLGASAAAAVPSRRRMH